MGQPKAVGKCANREIISLDMLVGAVGCFLAWSHDMDHITFSKWSSRSEIIAGILV
jgi:hypothetical protein